MCNRSDCRVGGLSAGSDSMAHRSVPVERRYSGLVPDEGTWDCRTIASGRLGVAPGPWGLLTVAVFWMCSPVVAEDATVTRKTMVADPPAGTVMPVMFRYPVPLVPPVGRSRGIRGARRVTDDAEGVYVGRDVVGDAHSGGCDLSAGVDEDYGVLEDVARIHVSAVQVRTSFTEAERSGRTICNRTRFVFRRTRWCNSPRPGY